MYFPCNSPDMPIQTTKTILFRVSFSLIDSQLKMSERPSSGVFYLAILGPETWSLNLYPPYPEGQGCCTIVVQFCNLSTWRWRWQGQETKQASSPLQIWVQPELHAPPPKKTEQNNKTLLLSQGFGDQGFFLFIQISKALSFHSFRRLPSCGCFAHSHANPSRPTIAVQGPLLHQRLRRRPNRINTPIISLGYYLNMCVTC